MYGTRFIKETELRLDLLKLLPNHIGYDFDVESLDDYDDFFRREERYFYEQDIYT